MLGLLRRKPPSRLELVKRGVADRVEQARDSLSDALSHVPVDQLDGVRQSLSDAAAQAWDAVAQTAGSVAHKAADSDVVKTAADRASSVRDAATKAASGAAATAAASASDKAADLKDQANDLKEQAKARAIALKETAAQAASDKAEAAKAAASQAAANKAAAAKVAAKAAQKAAKQAAKDAKKEAKSRIPSRDEVKAEVIERVPGVQVETNDTVSKLLWLAIGVLAGVAIGLLIAPMTGRRSRAVVKDKLNQAGQGAAELGNAAASKATDLSNRAAGLAHEAKAKIANVEDDADDNTIADRVRTALGENTVTGALERINVDCVDGVVTLRGPMLETAVQEAVTAVVRGVKGVREVHSDFLTANAPEDSEPFVG